VLLSRGSRSWPAQAHIRGKTPLMLSPHSGAGWRIRQPCFSRRTAPARDFGFPVRLTPATVAPGLNSSVQELLRFVSTAPHSLPTGERCSQGVSARASPDRCKFPGTCTAKAQLHFPGSIHTRTSAADKQPPLTGKPDLLAELYKYSNSRRTSSMAVGSIRRRMADCLQID
jgi:hypothetical protein